MSAGRERREGAGVFTARVEEGRIAVPPAVLDALGLADGARVVVRLSGEADAAALRRKGIGEEEVERICMLQGEPRHRVVRFLLVEGVQARRGTRGRPRP
jgi:hypothetical protein